MITLDVAESARTSNSVQVQGEKVRQIIRKSIYPHTVAVAPSDFIQFSRFDRSRQGLRQVLTRTV